MNDFNVGIIGAGPAGVFAALSVRDFYNADVTVFDWQDPLTTLLPTGGGRCNFSYFETDIRTFASYYPRGSKFMISILNNFSMNDTVDYFLYHLLMVASILRFLIQHNLRNHLYS